MASALHDARSVNVVYPWAPVGYPTYQTGIFGRYQVKEVPAGMFSPGYYVPRDKGQKGYSIHRKRFGKFPKEACLSVTRMQCQMYMPHVQAAMGTVVVVGLGTGLFLANIINKPEVMSVIVIERDREIINLFDSIARPEEWPGGQKLTIVSADAYKASKIFIPEEAFGADYLFVDVWDHLFPATAVSDTAALYDLFKPRSISWWTQEGAFFDWCRLHQKQATKIAANEAYRAWAHAIRLPLIGQEEPQMGSLSMAAAMVQLGGAMQIKDPRAAGEMNMRALRMLGVMGG